MLNQPTIEKLYTMKLHGMADAFRTQLEATDMSQLSFEERFAMLVDQQWLWKENRALAPSDLGKAERAGHNRRHRLPASTRARPQADSNAVIQRMGSPEAKRCAHRAYRYRQELVGLRSGAQGMP
jgi:hypothetical protein